MKEDERAVRERLESHTNDYEVGRKLHDVPPHVTHEVRLDGRRAVCKRATSDEGDPAMEARVMQHLETNTSVPVPHVLVLGDDYFVAEWCDEIPADGSVDEASARTMGAGLATLHAETTFESYGFLGARDGELVLDARESWHGTVRDFLADRRDFLRDGGFVADAKAAADALTFVRECPDLFRDVGEPVLCHGNYLPDHVGRDGGDVTTVIDFEHALVGPGEYDYWRTAIPLCAGPGGVDETVAEAFRAGYESVRELPPGFDRRGDVYRLIVVVSFFRSLRLQRQQTGAEATRTARRFRELVSGTIESIREDCDDW
ncbi:aminoglycoside phosphotransferase [Haladaptatus paucihalophilus DX253]|uniref:Aminoglycoside phosphotransferase n=1 Tax=Haladaptatus paucihalophilus DX253 TaxID=797209 RepID=E7QMV7_HALPU|nr:aminoglycoside phosphotransferase family protein [Haladaptatus paucihalophilus]EFW93752.1 aminoglycoside phosphotransferase [Haladaptatus paucihalophilus DX253]SHL49925.1 Phosphotransferase enzyme family protein [Haladaptatus paucihalophilus DX253]